MLYDPEGLDAYVEELEDGEKLLGAQRAASEIVPAGVQSPFGFTLLLRRLAGEFGQELIVTVHMRSLRQWIGLIDFNFNRTGLHNFEQGGGTGLQVLTRGGVRHQRGAGKKQ